MSSKSKAGRRSTRRDFLVASGAGAAALSFPTPLRCLGTTHPAFQSDGVLVVIYLRGGQDALNTIVPYKDDRYYEIRPTIAIAPKQGDGFEGVIRLDEQFGMHPAMRALKPLWDAKMFAPVITAGSPHPTRSHFDAQDFMEYASPGLRTARDGWLNRYLACSAGRRGQDSDLRALAMQGLLPRSLRGKYPVLAVPERGARQSGRFLDLFDDLYNKDVDDAPGEGMIPVRDGKKQKKSGKKGEGMSLRRDDPVVQTGRNTIRTLRRYQEIVGQGGQGGQGGRGRGRRRARSVYPRGRLGDRLADIAKVIKSGEKMEVAAVDWNGWDHHTGQGAEQGRHARMIGHVAESIGAFIQDLGEHSKRTVVMTMSEFGRTCRENGNMGTDHGHGGMVMLAGGPVVGGKVHGRWEGLQDNEMYQGRDLPVHTDFRDIMAEALTVHMGIKDLPKDFFPDFQPSKKRLGLFG